MFRSSAFHRIPHLFEHLTSIRTPLRLIMSATTSAPTAEGHSSRMVAFNKQTFFDPFLPLSPGEERLTQFDADFDATNIYASRQSALHNSDQTTPTISHHDHFSSTGLRGGEAYALDRHQLTDNDLAKSATSPETEDSPYSYNGTSSTNGYPSDFENPSMNEYAAQVFDNTFLLEADFGPLPLPEDSLGTGFLQDAAIEAVEEPPSATSTTSQPASHLSRKSTGLATLSSHLMSPVLTETTSPSSGNEESSPTAKTRLLGGGKMSRNSSQSTATGAVRADHFMVYAQQTPDLTGSSMEPSPEPVSRAELTQTTSPVVLIESYSRGDSPARSAFPINRTGSKRSRTSRSSHLAAPEHESSEEGGDEETFNDENEAEDRPGRPSSVEGPRTGLDPSRRFDIADETVPNFKDQAESAELGTIRREVQKWLATSNDSLGLSAEPNTSSSTGGYHLSGSRRRAKSACDPHQLERPTLSWGYSETDKPHSQDQEPSPTLKRKPSRETHEEFGKESDNASYSNTVARINQDIDIPWTVDDDQANIPGERKPEDAHPWTDPIYFPSHPEAVGQPSTSNAAMVRFAKRAADIETASRAATWGTTTRRMSEADLERIIGSEGLFSRLSISRDKGKDKSERRGSFLEQVEQAAAKLIPKRSNSNMRRKASEPTKLQHGQPLSNEHNRKDSLYGRKDSLQSRKDNVRDRKESLGSRTGSTSVAATLRRIPSTSKRPKSPKLNTGGAVAAMATQLATVGANGSISPTTSSSQAGAWQAIKRTARGEFHRTTSNEHEEPGLAALWDRQGGPPLPTLKSTPEEKDKIAPFGLPMVDDDEDVDSDGMVDEKGTPVEFDIKREPIVPTYDGFKSNVRIVTPKLAPYLVDRIGQEQLRRYKKLVEFKVKHAQAKQLGNCESGEQCVDKGGLPKYFPSKVSHKEPVYSHTGFSITGQEDLDEDEEAVADGAVSEAQFPPGVPVPPVKRLPAQFECPLCFTVKKFQKPSDWSKHVHEDLQPFTCTFPTCPDPKSFKRKADWVRHENERHRQLEWWTCTEDGCSHQCYRRDNFVQHLVREHKMPEPKAKTAKPNKPAVRGPAKSKARYNKESDTEIASNERVLMMVETCRHQTTKEPKEEPCRFCGITCNSWKKLTVHLARHMEQIGMPVLEMVRIQEVTADMIVSPIEQRLPSRESISPVDYNRLVRDDSMLGPLDLPVDMQNIKREFPGSYTPVQTSTGFQQSFYDNPPIGTFPWGHSSGNAAQTASQASPNGYVRGLDNAYMPDHRLYEDTAAIHAVPGTHQAGYMESPPEGTSSAAYPTIHGQMPQPQQTSYPQGQPYAVAMEQQTAFAAPGSMSRFVNQNIATTQPQQVPMAEPFGTAGDLPFSEASNASSIYTQQQQHHQLRQQQQHQHHHHHQFYPFQ